MEAVIRKALTTGIERLNAWADLLNSINVFPVADADTGRNPGGQPFPPAPHERVPPGKPFTACSGRPGETQGTSPPIFFPAFSR